MKNKTIMLLSCGRDKDLLWYLNAVLRINLETICAEKRLIKQKSVAAVWCNTRSKETGCHIKNTYTQSTFIILLFKFSELELASFLESRVNDR